MISSGGRFLQRPVACNDAAFALEVLGGGEGGGKEGEDGNGGTEVVGGGAQERMGLIFLRIFYTVLKIYFYFK